MQLQDHLTNLNVLRTSISSDDPEIPAIPVTALIKPADKKVGGLSHAQKPSNSFNEPDDMPEDKSKMEQMVDALAQAIQHR
jgi:hypothetical protein